MGVIKGDTRSLDYSSNVEIQAPLHNPCKPLHTEPGSFSVGFYMISII